MPYPHQVLFRSHHKLLKADAPVEVFVKLIDHGLELTFSQAILSELPRHVLEIFHRDLRIKETQLGNGPLWKGLPEAKSISPVLAFPGRATYTLSALHPLPAGSLRNT